MRTVWVVGLVGACAASNTIGVSAEGPSAEYQSYTAHIAAADASLRLNEVAAAQRWLRAAPEPFRGWEWRYLHARADESLGVLATADATVYELAFSPDGRRLAEACDSGSVVVRDAATGAEQLRLAAHGGQALRVAFSPDGKWLATAGQDRTAKLWDALTGEERVVFRGLATPVTSIDFSPDGTRIACGNYRLDPPDGGGAVVVGTVKVWDPQSGAELLTLSGGNKPLSMLRFSPDGRRIAASSWSGAVYLWDSDTAAPPRELRVPDEGVYTALNCVAFSPDGARIAAGSKDRTARVWNADTGQLLSTLRHEGWVTATAFAPDRQTLVTAAHDGLLRLWNVETGMQLAVLHGHRAGPWCLALSPDGAHIISAGNDRELRRWDLTYRDYGTLRRQGPEGCYASRFLHGGRRLVTCAYDGSISVWNAVTGGQVTRWTAHSDASCNTLAASADGRRLVSCSWDKTVKVWDADTAALLVTLPHETGVYHAEVSPDGRLVAAAPRNKTIVLSSVEDPPVQHTITLESGAACVAFSPDGHRVAGALGDGTVRIWRVADRQEEAVLRGHDGRVQAVAFSPDGTRLASGGDDGHVFIWDATRHALCSKTLVADAAVNRVVFSPDGARIAAASQHCTLLDATTGDPLVVLRPHQDAVWCLSFSQDGTRLASGSTDGSFAISDTASLSERLTQRRAALAAEADAEPHLDKLAADHRSPTDLAACLRADPTLPDAVRQAALDALLRTSVAQSTTAPAATTRPVGSSNDARGSP